MLKELFQIEQIVANKVCHFVCEKDTDINIIKEALFQFQKFIGTVEDVAKANQANAAASQVSPVAPVEPVDAVVPVEPIVTPIAPDAIDPLAHSLSEAQVEAPVDNQHA
jgi:hypothetical protein